MRELLKTVLNGIVLLFDTVVSLVDVLCFGHPFLKRKKLSKTGKSVSILANGPSARDIINNKPYLLSNGDLVSMNDAAAADIFFNLKPNYYILLDPAYFGGSWLGDKELTKSTFDETLKKLSDNLQKVDWKMTLLLTS